ncbi:MAG: PAS domain-containing protein [Planctomycetes bacterium]|nr:PAS domain-containing protein [Planctomycetota bacterium]
MSDCPRSDRQVNAHTWQTASPGIKPQRPQLDAGDPLPHGVGEPLARSAAAAIRGIAALHDKTLQAVCRAITDPLLLVDRNQRIAVCNDAAAQHLGRGVPVLIGLALSDVWAAVTPANICEQRMARIAEVFRTAAPVRFTDGWDGCMWDNTISPILGGPAEVEGVVVVARNVAEYGENAAHAEQLASLGMISATLAHELAQPLSVVQLALQNASAELERVDCPEVVSQDLNAGLAACARIADTISRFRELARRPGTTRELEVRIHPVVDKTFRLLALTAKQAGMKLRGENLEALPAIRMRENELDQLLFALVQNAVHAANGRKDRHLLIAGARQQDTVALRFQDNCGGIDPAHLPRIFEPFFTTKPRGKGTGLGLYIARRIVCQRGGQITVESLPGEGTTFTVTLPIVSHPGTESRCTP